MSKYKYEIHGIQLFSKNICNYKRGLKPLFFMLV